MPADAILMQLRVAGCIIVVALVRVLNIAVPVLYRNAINKLAEVSDLTHPTRGEKPITFTFMDVRPCILACIRHRAKNCWKLHRDTLIVHMTANIACLDSVMA